MADILQSIIIGLILIVCTSAYNLNKENQALLKQVIEQQDLRC